MKKIHEGCLETLIYLNNLCESLDINMYLFAGTLLGAVREKGFIPWDDDADVILIRKDYEVLKKYFEQNNTSNYEFFPKKNSKDYHISFGKLYNTNYNFIENTDLCINPKRGAWVDIFIYDNITMNESKRKLAYFFINTIDKLIKINLIKYNSNKDKGFKRIKYPIYIFNKTKLANTVIRRFLLNLRKIPCLFIIDHESNIVAELGYPHLTYNHFCRDIINKDMLTSFTLVNFEGENFKGFKDNHKYLTQKYGDYMVRPPVNEQVNHGTIEL